MTDRNTVTRNKSKKIMVSKKTKGREHVFKLSASWSIIGMIAVIGIVFVIFQLTRPNENAGAEKYLTEKYGSSFKVENDPNPPSAVGDPNTFYGVGYPTNNTELKFSIRRCIDTGARCRSSNYSDKYLDVLWSQQAKEGELKQLLVGIFNDAPKYNVSISLQQSELVKEYYGTTPNFNDVQSIVNPGISYRLSIHSRLNSDEIDITAQSQKLFSIVQFLQSKKYGQPAIASYVIFVNNPTEGAKRYMCSLNDQEIKEVRTANELIKCFEKK